MDRRGFFRRLSGRERVMRPPGAMPGETFTEICNGCAACVGACPQGIIRLASGDLPEMDFTRAGCTFCGSCAEACKPGALVIRDDLQSSWPARARISSGCLDRRGIVCRACESSCETSAIRFRPALGGKADVFVDPADCTGCGACISACHTGAISLFRAKINTTTSRGKAA